MTVLKADRMDGVLYVGLGMVAVGLVIMVVGLGDKGFQTLELRIVGPSIVLCGAMLAGLRILLCVGAQLGRRRGETRLRAENRASEGGETADICQNWGLLIGQSMQGCDWSDSQPQSIICEGSSNKTGAWQTIQIDVKDSKVNVDKNIML